MHLFLLRILLPELTRAIKYDQNNCANIVCEHDNVKVCGFRGSRSGEVTFRMFQDECAFQKYQCEENGMQGFKITSTDYCKQAFSDKTANNSSLKNYASVENEEEERAETGAIVTDATETLTNITCVQCDCNHESEPICAIRNNEERFIIRSFADECHMLQYNCQEKVNFSITDDYFCDESKNSSKTQKSNDESDKENFSVISQYTDSLENITCIQHNCPSDSKEICAVRLEHDRLINKRFDDECQMLQHNCEHNVNFTVTDNFLCLDDNRKMEVTDSNEISDTKEKGETQNIKQSNEENEYELEDNSTLINSAYPKNVVVTTIDITEDINKTIDNFFAASHMSGIPLQKVVGEESRRMIIKDTGPVNIFVPRAFVPANYTPVEQRLESKQFPEYSPLVKYCYHKCPEKCPEFYRPVCGARIDKTKQTPFVFFKNHCYMDKAKCMIKWAGYKDKEYTELEEMGFVFCGGYKLMNTMYMFPLVRILQKMGRLKKKGKIKFLMRDLGRYSVPLQG